MSITLHVVAGPATGQELQVGDSLELGRESVASAGRLGDDPQISRRHAVIRRTSGDTVAIEDLGSSNGTRVNGRLVAAGTPLTPGDRIELGNTVIEVRGPAAGAQVVAPPARAGAPAVLGPLPAFSTPDDMRHVATRRRRSPTVVTALAMLLVLAVAGIVVLLVRDDDSAASDGGGGGYDGTVYVESNNPNPNANSVLAFRYKDGSFRPMNVREYPTRGAGTQDLSNGGALDIEGSITTDPDKRFLFAVNAVSDTIAVFRIQGDGSLEHVEGSPFPSQGSNPASVEYSDGFLYVANKAHDSVRDLKKVEPNYASFKVGDDGGLTPVGQPQPSTPQASPTQAFVTPDGKFMMATDERGKKKFDPGKLHSFQIGEDGSLKPAPGSPYEMDEEILNFQAPDQPAWAQGLVALPEERLVYAGVANLGLLVVYSYDKEGRLSFVKQMENKGSVLPCWTEMSKDKRFIYTGNAGNNTVSVFDIKTDPRNPKQIQTFKLKGGGNPWNFEVDPTGKFIFLVNMRSADFVPRGDGNTLHTLTIGPDGKLSEPPHSPVPLPVAIDTNPWGIAVVPRKK